MTRFFFKKQPRCTYFEATSLCTYVFFNQPRFKIFLEKAASLYGFCMMFGVLLLLNAHCTLNEKENKEEERERGEETKSKKEGSEGVTRRTKATATNEKKTRERRREERGSELSSHTSASNLRVHHPLRTWGFITHFELEGSSPTSNLGVYHPLRT